MIINIYTTSGIIKFQNKYFNLQLVIKMSTNLNISSNESNEKSSEEEDLMNPNKENVSPKLNTVSPIVK